MITRVGITSIFVTHDQDEAIEVADEIIITNHGHIEQAGTPIEIYSQPKTPFVTEFMGSPTRISNITSFHGYEELGEGLHAVVRPEHVSDKKDRAEPLFFFRGGRCCGARDVSRQRGRTSCKST